MATGIYKRKPFSKEHRKNISKSRMGNKNPMFGKHIGGATGKHWKLSQETRLMHSEISQGKNAGGWKGGITPINAKIRTSKEYLFWRKSCMVRDNFTDQKTGISGGELVVHHINNFADFPELRTSIENGITLSKKSHREFHKIYGRRNNTIEQLEEFLEVLPVEKIII